MATAASTWGLLADVSCKPRHSGHSEHSAFHYDVLVAFVDRSPGGKYSLNLTLSVGSATRVQTLRVGVYWKEEVKNWTKTVGVLYVSCICATVLLACKGWLAAFYAQFLWKRCVCVSMFFLFFYIPLWMENGGCYITFVQTCIHLLSQFRLHRKELPEISNWLAKASRISKDLRYVFGGLTKKLFKTIIFRQKHHH